ncbi:hypothetical protein Q5752_000752 [Cryptotrichosporon argae]
MRIHEVVEACLEHTAYEGVLGCTPFKLHAHVRTLDAAVDDDLFRHVFRLLSRHQVVEVLITAYPADGDDGGSVGPAPLPALPAHALTPDELVRVVRADDGELAPVRKDDLAGLVGRWGSRVRVRVTEEEMYYRLTGSHQRVARVTPLVLMVLQAAAQAREHGVPSGVLGQITGKDQKTVFYIVKVLEELGLAAKCAMTYNGQTTNLILYHRFKERNPVYRAHNNMSDPAVSGSLADLPSAASPTPAPAQDDDDDSDADDGDDDSKNAKPIWQQLGLNFTPFSDSELMVGHVGKQRILAILEHPDLEDHIFPARRMLLAIGWTGPRDVKRRRLLIRHVHTLITAGIIDRLDVPGRRWHNLRLAKYNPDHEPGDTRNPTPERALAAPDEVVVFDPAAYDQPGDLEQKGVALNKTIEHQLLRVIDESGVNGTTINGIHISLGHLHRRMIDFHLGRFENGYHPPHLSHLLVYQSMEQVLRERRLRVFTVRYYRQFVTNSGQDFDPVKFPPPAATAGHWADLSNRSTWATRADRNAVAAALAHKALPGGYGHLGSRLSQTPRPKSMWAPRPSVIKRPRKSKAADDGESAATEVEWDPSVRVTLSGRPVKYKNEAQARGRPRKYVIVVNPDGSRNRTALGDLLVNPDLPEVLIWFKPQKRLVPGPPGYTGVGPAPEISEEEIMKGNTREFYDDYPRKDGKGRKGAKGKAASKAVGNKGRGKKSKQQTKSKESENELDEEDEAAAEEKEDEGDEEDELAEDGKEDDVVDVSDRSQPTVQRVVPDSVQAQAGPSRDADKRLGDRPEPERDTPAKRACKKGARENEAETMAGMAETSENARKRAASPTAPAPGIEPPKKRGRPKKMPPAPAVTALEAHVDDAGNALPDARTVDHMDIDPQLLGADATGAAQEPTPATVAGPPAAKALRPVAQSFRLPDRLSASLAAAQSYRKTSATPMRGASNLPVTPLRVGAHLAPRASIAKSEGRANLSHFRRQNELYQCLADHGGILERSEFRNKLREWMARVAGTDHPNAPPVAGAVDAKTFERTCEALIDAKRFKKEITGLGTTTGRWVQIVIYSLADLPEEQRQTYKAAFVGNNNAPALPFGVTATPARTVLGEVTGVRSPNFAQSEVDKRRARLMRETNMAALSYGWKTGRHVRAWLMWRAIVRAISTSPDARSIVSTSPRIVSMSLINESLTIGEYLACIYRAQYDDALWHWLREGNNRDMPLALVPPEFDIGREPAKVRNLLQFLVHIRLIDPLTIPPLGGDASIEGTNERTGNAYRFNVAESIDTSANFIVYDWVPIYHLAVSDTPGLLGVVPARTVEDIDAAKTVLKNAALDPHMGMLPRVEFGSFPFRPDFGGMLAIDANALKLTRLESTWIHRPVICFEQQRMLEQQVDPLTGSCRLSTPKEIDDFAYENALPVEYVKAYVRNRIRTIKERSDVLYLSRARQARHGPQLVKDDTNTIYREALADERGQFPQLYNAALERAGMQNSRELLAYVKQHQADPTGPIDADELDRLISGFESYRADAAKEAQAPRARSSKHDGQSNKTRARRATYRWTAEDEAMLIEGTAVLYARYRSQTAATATNIGGAGDRVPHTAHNALQQLFPGYSVTGVLMPRVRFINRRPGRQAYFDHLVDEYHKLWVEYKGSEALPGGQPVDSADFDLKEHIDFLRSHVDTTAMRPITEEQQPDLPLDLQAALEMYHWTYRDGPARAIGSIWDPTVAESQVARLHQLASESVTVDWVQREDDAPSAMQRLVQAAIKMVVSTPEQAFRANPSASHMADRFLAQFSAPEADAQLNGLIADGVLARTVNTTRTASRGYAYTREWAHVTEGPVPPAILDGAAAFTEQLHSGKPVDWPIVGPPGAVLALMSAVSAHDAVFEFAVPQFPDELREREQYLTRKLNDDNLEFDIKVSLAKPAADWPPVVVPPHRKVPVPTAWDAAGRVRQDDKQRVLRAIEEAGAEGITRGQLQLAANLTAASTDAVLARLAKDEAPIFWAGYETARVVSASHWSAWAIKVPVDDAEPVRVAPRRWVDLWGDVIEDEWKAVVRGARSMIIANPGVTETKLRQKLALDRLEANNVLQVLLETGRARRTATGEAVLPPVEATDAAEGDGIAWWPVDEAAWA